MQFDNASFEKGAQQSMSTLDKLKQALKFDKVNMTPLQEAFSETEATATKAGFNIKDVWLKMSSIIEQEIAEKVVNAGKKMLSALSIDGIKDGFNEYQLKMGSIQTIMAGTGESLATVNRYLDDLNTYSDKTIYSFSDMTQNIGKFTNAGVKLRDAVDAIKGIANEAAVSGANANEASRAMYNFAQALSAGYVKLIDWKSIENANMATKEFKETLLDVAVAMGNAEKTADGMYKILTTNNKGKVMDELVSGTKNFNDSLQYQWMTTEVLTKALKLYATDVRSLTDEEKNLYEQELKNMGLDDKQIEKFEQLGIKATDAASEIKTFTMLMDTLKEAIGSGWAMTWQLIIGDFEQAKAMWTEVGTVLSGVIDGMSDARNKFLKAGLQTGWEEFTTMEGKAIPQAEKFREVLVDLARDQGKLTKEQYIGINSTETFMKSLHEYGWLTGGLLSEAVEDYTKMLDSMSDAEIDEFGIKKSDVEQMKKLNEELKAGTINADEFAKKMINLGGRENLLQGLRNIFEGIKSIIKPIAESFDNVFGVMDPQKLYQFTENFKNFTAQLRLSISTTKALRDTFTVVFSAIKFVLDTIGVTFKGLGKLVLPTLRVFDALIGIIGGVISAFTSLFNAGKKSTDNMSLGSTVADKYLGAMDAIASVLNKVADVIKGMSGYAKQVGYWLAEGFGYAKNSFMEFWREFKEMPVVQQMMADFTRTIDSLRAKMEPLRNTLRNLFSGIKVDMKSTFSWDKLNNILTIAYDKIKKILTVVKDFAKRIKDFFKDLKSGKSIVESFRDNFGDIIDKIKELKDNVVDFFTNLFEKGDELGDKFNLKAIQQAIHDFVANITPEQITMIAIAGTFMLIAINLLRLSDALRNAVEAFTGIGMAIKNVINSYIKKQKSVILQVAESIVIVAAALWVLSTVPKDKLESAVGALMTVTGLLGILTVAMTLCGIAMAKWGGKTTMVELATGLVMVSGAFMMSALTLKVLESVNLSGILPKILVMSGIMLGLVGLSALMAKLDKFKKGSLTMVACAGALLLASQALVNIGSLPADKLEAAMDVMLKMMLGLAAITFASGKVGIFSAVGLLAIVLTMDKLLPAIERIVNYDYSGIDSGMKKNEDMLKKLGGLVLIMTAIGMLAGNRIKGAGIAMLSIAATFAILVGIAKLAGMMKPSELRQGESFLIHMGLLISLLELCSAKSRMGMWGGKAGGEGSKVFTRIAIAMGILLGVAKLASMMKKEDLIKGELAVLGLVGIIGAMLLVTKITGNSEGVVKSVSAMIFAVSLILGEIALLSMIPIDNLKPAVIAMISIIGALGLLALAMNKSGKIFDKRTQGVTGGNTVGFIAALATIVAISAFVIALAQMPTENVLAAAGSMVAIIAAVALLSKALGSISTGANWGMAQAAVEALVMTAVIGSIIYGLAYFMSKNNIDANSLVKAAAAISIALLGITPALLVLSRFGAYTGNKANGGSYKRMTTAVGSAIGALVVVAIAIGALSRFGGDGTTMIKAATAIAIGLIAICAPIAVLGALGKYVKGVNPASMVTIILGALGALAGVTAALIVMSNMANPENLIVSAQALSIGLMAICVPIAVLGLVGQFCAAANPIVMGVALAGAILAMYAVSEILIDFASRINPVMLQTLIDALPVLATAIGGVALIAIAIAAAGALSGGNFAAVFAGGLAMVEAIGVLILIVSAIALLGAALNKWEGLKKGLETGLDYLVIIAGKIGEAIGAFVGGIGVGFTSQMIKMSENLTTFSENLIPFADNMKKISADVVTGCKNLAEAVLYLTAAEFLDGIASFLGLGTKDFSFDSLGIAVVAFANTVSGLTEDAVTKAKVCSDIALILSQVAGNLDREGGWIQKITGQKDLGKFSENIALFGVAIKSFIISVAGLTADSVELAQRAADTAAPMVDLSKTLTGTGGLVQKIAGEKDLGQFGMNLASFANGLRIFVMRLLDIEKINPSYVESVQKCADATGPLIDLANGLENSGGILARIVGDNTLDSFGATLIPFANSMRIFVNRLNSMASEVPNYITLITDSVTCATLLVELSNKLENIGGVGSVFSGDNTLDRFGDTLESFGGSLQTYSASLGEVDVSAITNANSAITELVNIGSLASGIAADAFNGLATAIQSISTLPIATISNEVTTNTPVLTTAYTTMFTTLTTLINTRITTDTPTFVKYGKAIMDGIKTGITTNTVWVSIAINAMITTIRTKLGELTASSKYEGYGRNITNGISTGIAAGSQAAAQTAWYAGSNIVNGLKKGIDENAHKAVQAAKDMVTAINKEIEKVEEINSPSRVMQRYGKFIALGMAKGISDYTYTAVGSTTAMAEDIVVVANNIIDQIAAAIDDNIDTDPVIRPVLDTSDIEYKASHVGQLFDSSDLALAYTASGHMKAIAPSGQVPESSDTPDSVVAPGAQINFTQNNYSPKELNRYEIYRNTKNQISQLKGALV